MTEQRGDRLLYKGKNYAIDEMPLGQNLSKSDILRPGDFGCSSACWRGYIGSWEIDDNKLFLVGLDGYPVEGSTDLNYVYPEQDRVFADWFTGHIILKYVLREYKRSENTEKDISHILEFINRKHDNVRCIRIRKGITFTIEKGIIVQKEEFDNRKKAECSQLLCGYMFDGVCVNSWRFLQKLIAKSKDANVKTKSDKKLPYCAIYSSEFLKFLTEKDANVNEKIYMHYLSFLLRCAVTYSSDVDTLKFLIEKGGGVIVKYPGDKTILHRIGDKTLLHHAAGNTNIEIWKFLIEKGLDVNAKTTWGETVLHDVVRQNSNVEVLKYLIERGADLKNDTCEETLIYRAAYNPNVEIVKCLVENGVNVNTKNRGRYTNGLTALHCAANVCFHNVKVVKYLVDNGADVNATCGRGNTPLDSATPLHYACKDTIKIQNILRKAGGKSGKELNCR